MVHFDFIIWSALLILCLVEGQSTTGDSFDLPSWITENPAFQSPKTINSITPGNGSISSKKAENLAWLIDLNDKKGYGVEIELEKLSINPDSDNYVMIAGWPLSTKNFKEVKLFTGRLKKSEKLRIPDTKKFIILYSALGSFVDSELQLKYKRYGDSYEKKKPSPDSPIKKETLYEIQFRGKPPDDYFDVEFIKKFKEAVRIIAQKYCLRHDIPFVESTPTDKMVLINRISYCPFEWPDRDICASIQHSVFVSGTKIPDGLIMDYELTADNLKLMWMEAEHPEVEELGIVIFKLPETSTTILWWTLIIGAVIGCALIGILIYWTVEKYSKVIRVKTNSAIFKVVKRRKMSKMKLANHQSVPAFMYQNNIFDTQKFEEKALKPINKEAPLKNKPEQRKAEPAQSRFKNYCGSIYFSNKTYEDEEDVVEFRRK